MTNTLISAATHATAPINPASRIPLSDPNQAGVALTASASDVARAGSAVVLTLSSLGIVNDATNGLAYGAAAPAGATGQEVAINAALAAAYAAAGGRGLRVIWDVAVAVGAPIYLPGDFVEVIFPTKACGIILRANAQCPLLRIKGMDANMAVAGNTQKTFGKFDPAAPGGSHAYRVFDPTFVNASRLKIEGGTLNGNISQQSGVGSTSTYGVNAVLQLWGVDQLRLENIDVVSASGYSIHVSNVRDFAYDNIYINTNGSSICDGLHINGPMDGIRGGSLQTLCGDDDFTLSADDISDHGVYVTGTNYPCGGDVTDARCQTPKLISGTACSVRILSAYHRVDDVELFSTRGIGNATNFIIDNNGGSVLCTGSGNVGHIRIVADSHDGGSGPGGGVASAFVIGANSEFIEFIGRYRRNALAWPDITTFNGFTIQKLHVDWHGYQPAGAANAEPVLLVKGAIKELIMTGSMLVDSSLGTIAAPFLKTATGANITLAVVNVVGDHITNLIDHAAGTLTAVKFDGGAHTNAGGGSPLAIASGLTVANYLWGNLMFKTGTAPFSGSGTATVSSATNLNYSGP